MTICPHDHHACDCQPDEGVPCRKDRAMTTEIEELVKRLHALSNDLVETEGSIGDRFTLPNEAAAALEAQAAQLKAFREALTKISTRNLGTDGSEVPRGHKPDYLLSCAEQIARDALMSALQMEKKDGVE